MSVVTLPMPPKDQGDRRRRRWLRWSLYAGLLPLCIIAFYLIENWRGERAWAAEQERQRGLGESLIFEDHLPKPHQVPEIENAAAASVFTTRLNPQTKASVPAFDLTDVLADFHSPEESRGMELTLEQWQQAFAISDRFPKPPVPGSSAQDVLHALTLFENEIAELHAIADRPFARFPSNWEQGIMADLPQTNVGIELIKILLLRVRAELALGLADQALADVLLMLRVTEWVRVPHLLGLVVEQAMVLQAIHAVRQGLDHQAWTESQLAELDIALARFDLPGETLLSLRGERALSANTTRIFMADRSRMLHLYEQMRATPLQLAFIRLMPNGWLLQIQAHGCRETERMLNELRSGMTAPGHFAVLPAEPASTAPHAYPLGAWLASKLQIAPSVFSFVLSGARDTAARLALARTAVNLSRHAKTYNRLPETLPPSLPPDPVNGQPLRYQLLDQTRYRLWSVGPNEQDDGGSLHSYNATDTLDWVWASDTL
jgi:hypothetical protein